MRQIDEDAYVAFVTARAAPLRRTAYLLCRDWPFAEDLVQATFVKLYVAWPRISRRDTFDAYVRTTLVRTWLDEQRRPFRRRESRSGVVPEVASPAGPDVELQDVLRRALERVPPRQRAALVLRYAEDLSVEDTATALGCSAGTVKSQTARGLANLRSALAREGVIDPDPLLVRTGAEPDERNAAP